MMATRSLVGNLMFALALTVAAFEVPAMAAPHARLSSDLVEHLAKDSQAINVIVHGDRATVQTLADRYNVTVKRWMKSGAVLQLTAGQLAALSEDDTVDHLSSDLPTRASGDVTIETISADAVWAGSDAFKPLSGAGIGVAVIDSGVDTRHQSLRNRVIASQDFTRGDGTDRYGHGTHVAAIIAGGAGQSADTSIYSGVAPGAQIVSLRVLGNDGTGTVSSVIEAIDWAIDHRREYNIRIINLSLGAPVTQSYRDDPLCEAAERAVAAGIVVVASAGNYGKTQDGQVVFGGITAPANDPTVLTVGALDAKYTPLRADDEVASYSSKGPTLYDYVLKPDLVAPGSHVVSAEAVGSYLASTYPERHVAGSGYNGYIQLSGTSMAAAVVSGAAALLLQEHPRLSPNEAKVTLQATSSLIPGEGLVVSGAGSISALAAVEFTGTPGNGSGGAERLVAGSARTSFESGRDAFASHTIIWGQTTFGQPTIWGRTTTKANTIIWGQTAAETIIWGQHVEGQTIIWGQAAASTIIWGQAAANTIIWGQAAANTIIWGQAAANTIIWGQAAANTIIWGQVDSATIIWGQNTLD